MQNKFITSQLVLLVVVLICDAFPHCLFSIYVTSSKYSFMGIFRIETESNNYCQFIGLNNKGYKLGVWEVKGWKLAGCGPQGQHSHKMDKIDLDLLVDW